jgi:hypothetical protein
MLAWPMTAIRATDGTSTAEGRHWPTRFRQTNPRVKSTPAFPARSRATCSGDAAGALVTGYMSSIPPRSRLRSSGVRSNSLPMSRTVRSISISAAPTASVSCGLNVRSCIRRIAWRSMSFRISSTRVSRNLAAAADRTRHRSGEIARGRRSCCVHVLGFGQRRSRMSLKSASGGVHRRHESRCLRNRRALA